MFCSSPAYQLRFFQKNISKTLSHLYPHKTKYLYLVLTYNNFAAEGKRVSLIYSVPSLCGLSPSVIKGQTCRSSLKIIYSIGASRGLINILSTKGLRVRICRFAYKNKISLTLKSHKWCTNERALMKDRLILHLYHTLSTSTKPMANCSMKVIFT